MSGDEQAKLWLLSNAGTTSELSLVNTVTGSSVAYYPSQASQLTAQSHTEYGTWWWLRSPNAALYNYARLMLVDGGVIGNGVGSAFALRPAFQINLG